MSANRFANQNVIISLRIRTVRIGKHVCMFFFFFLGSGGGGGEEWQFQYSTCNKSNEKILQCCTLEAFGVSFASTNG